MPDRAVGRKVVGGARILHYKPASDGRVKDRGPKAGPPPTVSILVVSYGTRDMTLECLESIECETKTLSYEVIVVDNASTDGSPEAIAKRFPQYCLFALPENIGFAAANNLAAKSARGEYILLLNPDTKVLASAIDKIVNFAERRPKACVWGGRTLNADGSLNPTSFWRHMSVWNLFCRAVGLSKLFPRSSLFHSHNYGGWKRQNERNVDVITGCFLLIKRAMWRRLDGFSPEFFMYGEDADLCMRAIELGARPAVTPEATIIHYGSATEPNESRKAWRMLAAKSLLIKRQFRPLLRPLALGLLALHPALKSVVTSGGEREMWRDVWRARRSWLAGDFGTEAITTKARATANLPRAAQTVAEPSCPPSRGTCIFNQQWWLDAAAGDRWVDVRAELSSGQSALLTVYRSTKAGFPALLMPPLTRTLSPHIAGLEGKSETVRRMSAHLIDQIVQKLPTHVIFNHVIECRETEALAFRLSGFSVNMEYTYRIDDCSDLDRIKSEMRDTVRRAIRKAQERVRVECNTISPSEFAAFYFSNLYNRGREPIHPVPVYERIVKAALEQGAGEILTARAANGSLCASIFTIWDQKTMYYLLTSQNRSANDSGSVAMLIWHAIQNAAHRGLAFDFDGFGDRGTALFLSQFGGKVHTRFRINRMPKLLQSALHLGPRFAASDSD